MAEFAKAPKGQKIMRKLTLREIMGSKAAMLRIAQLGATKDENGDFKGMGQPVDACIISGRVFDAKADEGDNGSFIKLMGSFQAINLQTGELSEEVNTCIIPNYVANRIVAALANGGKNIEFKVKFLLKYDEAAAVGYVFEAENMSDALAPTQSTLASVWGDTLKLAKPAASTTPPALTDDSQDKGAPAPQRKKAPAPAPAPKGKRR